MLRKWWVSVAKTLAKRYRCNVTFFRFRKSTAEQLQLSHHSGSQLKARGTSLQTELVPLALSSWPSYPASCVASKIKLPHETRICQRPAVRCKTVNSKTQPQSSSEHLHPRRSNHSMQF